MQHSGIGYSNNIQPRQCGDFGIPCSEVPSAVLLSLWYMERFVLCKSRSPIQQSLNCDIGPCGIMSFLTSPCTAPAHAAESSERLRTARDTTALRCLGVRMPCLTDHLNDTNWSFVRFVCHVWQYFQDMKCAAFFGTVLTSYVRVGMGCFLCSGL